ncbi:MAG TPA: HIT family protein [Candidatus Saccharimonadia bacterium]|nr:HIT family protein [Candidatus Saccharimonadia bacterium]
MAYDPNCLFCKFAKGEIPCHKIWEDDKHFAFLTIFPNTEGFTVVATKDHLPSEAFANSDQALSELILATKKAANLLKKAYPDVGRVGMFFEGFGVDHLHSKLFPMHGTGDMKAWAKIESPKPGTFFETYPGYLSSHDSARMDDAKLAAIAEKIKNA